ncbi:phosphohydrolase [Candidatus Fermentibacteria bacterium]|nr:MAG: phosphohydrolase [Candidatus Fermentibacteria bacterium]
MDETLLRMLDFLQEIEKLKAVTRRNLTLDGGRLENSAEHSWSVSMMAITLHEYLPENTDLIRVIKMLLIHDIVEIDAGDIYLYDDRKRRAAVEKEKAAADRIFSLLPENLRKEFTELWQEFDARETVDAKSAAAMDTLHPLINNNVTGRKKPVPMTCSQVLEKRQIIREVSDELWQLTWHLMEKGVEKGLFRED